MMLTTKSRYAVMAILDIASRGTRKPVTLDAISEAQNVTVHYLEQIFSRLKKAGIVKSVKGPGGGYLITKNLADITVAELILASDESIKMTKCNNDNITTCNKKGRCLTHDLWSGLTKHIYTYLNNITIADLCRKNEIVNI